MPTRIQIELAGAAEILPLRELHRQEMKCQIVHDSLHRREGWTRGYRLFVGGTVAAFGSVALAGPWQDKPTIYEFYVLPPHRPRVFELFEVFLDASHARFLEVQSNDVLLAVLLHTYGRDVASEKIVFADQSTTAWPSRGAQLLPLTSDEALRTAIDQRQGGGEWRLELEGTAVATGGILFHYNLPYGDIYMEVAPPYRQQGWGTYLVQELKRICYELGAIPAARCNPTNHGSRRTLLKAGFLPYAHILQATVADRPAHHDAAPDA